MLIHSENGAEVNTIGKKKRKIVLRKINISPDERHA